MRALQAIAGLVVILAVGAAALALLGALALFILPMLTSGEPKSILLALAVAVVVASSIAQDL